MSDKDVVQRDGDSSDTTVRGVVELGHSKPKQDLWDLDDDIFKPLLERVDQERRQEYALDAIEKANERAEKLVSHDDFSALDFDSYQPQPVAQMSSASPTGAPRRKSVLDQAPGSVTIRSEQANMPRVIWQQKSSPFKKIFKFIETLNRRTQLTLAGLCIFVAWNVVAIICARLISLSVFQYDPLYLGNWEMLYNLYNKGSTFQWSFVLFYMIVLMGVPIFGAMLAIRGAKELRPLISAIEKLILLLPRSVLRLVFGKNVEAEPYKPTPSYAVKPQYRGASFKMDPKDAEEETSPGGSIGGGSGGGHGRPSWQGGPANTQAFPRLEQGRR